jgi:ankyrin repeat protein
MKRTAIAVAFALASLSAHGAGDSVGMTDTGAPDFKAIERLLNNNDPDARRRLMEAIGAMDAYARKASPKADELVILGRAYLRAMGNGGGYRAGELATKALKLDPKHGVAHLLLAELAGYAQCASCAEESLANARASGVDEASVAAIEGFTYWIQAAADTKNRAVGEKPPLDRAIEAYERAANLEKNPARLASHRAALFELERSQGNHAKAMEHGEALLAGEDAGEDFIGKYATFLLYERGDLDRAAPLAARSASNRSIGDSSETFAMVLFRIWADGYLADAKDPHNRIKLETAKGANRDLGAVFAKSLSSTATMPVAEALLKAGLVKANDPSMRDALGNTPLANAVAGARADYAQAGGNEAYGEPLNDAQFAIVQMLLKQGANPNAFIWVWNQTALGHAASRGDVRIVKLLLKHGANVHARVGEGATPLAEAAESARLKEADEIAALLLARDVPVSASNNRGETALHAAARNGNTKLIERLLKAGADPMAKDNSGWRPLELATSFGHRDAVKTLLAAGAQVSAVKNACGSTSAVDIAKRMQNQELLELLRPYVREGI